MDAGKQVPRMLPRLYSFRKRSNAAEAELFYLKEQRIFKPISMSRPYFLDFGNAGHIVKDLGTDPCK